METLPIGVSGRCIGEVHVLAGEMFCQGRSYGDGALVGGNRNRTGRRIVKYDPQAALVFTGELAHLERAGFGRGFPVHKANGILGRMFADEVKLAAASSEIRGKFPSHHRQDVEEVVGFQQCGIDQQLTAELDLAALDKK